MGISLTNRGHMGILSLTSCSLCIKTEYHSSVETRLPPGISPSDGPVARSWLANADPYWYRTSLFSISSENDFFWESIWWPTYSLGHMWCPFTDQWTPWMISRWKFISSSLVTSRVIASDICAYGLHVESRNLNREVFISHIDNHSIQLMLSDGDSTWGCLGKTNFDCTAGYSYSLGRVKQTAVFFNVTVEEGEGQVAVGATPPTTCIPYVAYVRELCPQFETVIDKQNNKFQVGYNWSSNVSHSFFWADLNFISSFL